MGTSISLQEELFLSQQWSELLQQATRDDQACTATNHASPGSLDGQSTTGFRLSSIEWQALLAVLECENPATAPNVSSTASKLCDRLQPSQLTCPLLSLAVHAYAWWAEGINDDAMRAKLNALVELTAAAQALRDDKKDVDESPPKASSSSQSRRQRVLGALRKRVKHEDAPPADMHGVSIFDHSVILFKDILNLRLNSDHIANNNEERSVQRSLDTLRSSTVEQPVVAVALALLLALYCVLYPSPTHAVEGVSYLRRLVDVMDGKLKSRKTEDSVKRTPLLTLCPCIRHVDTALTRRQYELDVQQCITDDGISLNCALSNSAPAKTTVDLASMTPETRWAWIRSTYVGQQHVWTVLETHFLSADLLDTEKPTVIVLFGPSGFGKSEMAKRVASAIHAFTVDELESSGKLIHIHMPSFCTKDSIYSLVDPPAAHVGDGILLSALRVHPDAVVVLDEFEKSTAEAVQHIWLSAFQKNGVLRSLKHADRSVSTKRTTFILTCNIAADAISSRSDAYIGASTEHQEAVRQLLETLCRETCRQTLSDPFINRVDYFLPFMPYTRTEQEQFVCMSLKKLFASQAGKHRVLHATPRCVQSMVEELRTFHAATIEEILRPLLVQMVSEGFTNGVLTVKEHVLSTKRQYVLIPTFKRSIPHDTGTPTWESIPGGEICLQQWGDVSACVTAQATPASKKDIMAKTGNSTATLMGSSTSIPTLQPVSTYSVESGLRQIHLDTQTAREMVLERDLAAAKELLREKDVQIATLKETITLLEKLLALAMMAVFSCCTVLAVVIGLKLTLLLIAAITFTAVVLMKLPLGLVLRALKAFAMLCPYHSGLLLAFILVWVHRALISAASC